MDSITDEQVRDRLQMISDEVHLDTNLFPSLMFEKLVFIANGSRFSPYYLFYPLLSIIAWLINIKTSFVAADKSK